MSTAIQYNAVNIAVVPNGVWWQSR